MKFLSALGVATTIVALSTAPPVAPATAPASARTRVVMLDSGTPPHLRRVFLTHLHSDHTVGLPDLMLTPWVLEPASPLEVYGPPGTKRMVDLLAQAYSKDIELRLHGGEPSNKTGYRAEAHDVGAGVVYRDTRSTRRSASRRGPRTGSAITRAYHTSTIELAAIATRAHPKLLVLYHELYWGDDDTGLVRQVRSGFAGTVVAGRDLGVY